MATPNNARLGRPCGLTCLQGNMRWSKPSLLTLLVDAANKKTIPTGWISYFLLNHPLLELLINYRMSLATFTTSSLKGAGEPPSSPQVLTLGVVHRTVPRTSLSVKLKSMTDSPTWWVCIWIIKNLNSLRNLSNLFETKVSLTFELPLTQTLIVQSGTVLELTEEVILSKTFSFWTICNA